MTENMINTLNTFLTKIPDKTDTGYSHSDFFYSCESKEHPAYIGCLLCDTTKEESNSISHHRYIYIMEEFEKKENMQALTKKLTKIQKSNSSDFYLGYIPISEIAQKCIKTGCTSISWTVGTAIFTLINLSPEPSDYSHLPGIFNEFINTEQDPKLMALAKTIISSQPNPKQPPLFRGLQLLKKNIAGWSLAAIYNNINDIMHENEKYTIVKFEGIYRQKDTQNGKGKRNRQMEIHITFAPNCPQNILNKAKEKKSIKVLAYNTPKASASYHNKDPGYIIDLYGIRNKKASCHRKNIEIEKIMSEATAHINRHLASTSRAKS